MKSGTTKPRAFFYPETVYTLSRLNLEEGETRQAVSDPSPTTPPRRPATQMPRPTPSTKRRWLARHEGREPLKQFRSVGPDSLRAGAASRPR